MTYEINTTDLLLSVRTNIIDVLHPSRLGRDLNVLTVIYNNYRKESTIDADTFKNQVYDDLCNEFLVGYAEIVAVTTDEDDGELWLFNPNNKSERYSLAYDEGYPTIEDAERAVERFVDKYYDHIWIEDED